MAMVEVNWNPDRRERRRFGLAVLLGLTGLGALLQFALHRPGAGLGVWTGGAVVGLLGWSGTRAILPFYWFVAGLGFAVRSAVAWLALGIVYFGLVTPLGLFFRGRGRDRLRLRRARGRSGWDEIDETNDPARTERQF